MISVIICSTDERKFSAVAENYRRLLAAEAHEIIRIGDARSMCEGYNRGAAQSRGDVLIFSHDDIELLSDEFAGRLRKHLEHFDLVGVAGTTKLVYPFWAAAGPPHVFGQVVQRNGAQLTVTIFATPDRRVGNIRAIDGCFMAARRAVLERVKFDEQTFDAWHHYDVDFSLCAQLAGLRVGVACDLDLLHDSEGRFMEAAWQLSAGRFLRKHAGRMDAGQPRQWRRTEVYVGSKPEAVEVMNSPNWPVET